MCSGGTAAKVQVWDLKVLDLLSTGREVSATNSPRRLEAPKLHNPIAIRLNLLLDSMEN